LGYEETKGRKRRRKREERKGRIVFFLYKIKEKKIKIKNDE
jgi:hypothetical protein